MNLKGCWKMNSKKMKKLLYLIFVGCVSISVQAQDAEKVPQQDITAKEKIQAARIGLITQRLGLTSEQAEKFWPIYNEFTQKRTGLRQQYKEAERNVNPNNPDPKQQQALVDLGFKIKQDELTLEKKTSAIKI